MDTPSRVLAALIFLRYRGTQVINQSYSNVRTYYTGIRGNVLPYLSVLPLKKGFVIHAAIPVFMCRTTHFVHYEILRP